MRWGFVPPPHTGIATSVVVRPRWSIRLKQREELTAVLVQVVADGLWTLGPGLGAYAVATNVITRHEAHLFPAESGPVIINVISSITPVISSIKIIKIMAVITTILRVTRPGAVESRDRREDVDVLHAGGIHFGHAQSSTGCGGRAGGAGGDRLHKEKYFLASFLYGEH